MSLRQLLVTLAVGVALLVVPSAVADRPVLNVSDITVDVNGVTSTTVDFSGYNATDGEDGTLPISCSPASGSVFSLGATTVNCQATDSVLDTGVGSFTVTVQDTTPPSVSVPGDQTIPVDGVTSASYSYTASAHDGPTSLPAPSCSPAGTTFPLGATVVTCSATDAAGNTGSASFTVTVSDTTPPTVTVPANQTIPVNGATSASFPYTASATDGPTSLPAPSCSPPGTTFPLGLTTVTCTATDAAGNPGSASFTVTVSDTTPPVITVPSPITKNINNATTTTVTYSATALDGTTPVTPTCSPASGSSFPLGVTTVTCNATDAAGNPAAPKSFTVTVVDNTPPVVGIASGPPAQSTSRSASFDFTASEGATSCQLDSGGFSACSSPASYSGLGDGSHTFTVKATDAASNAATASQTWAIDATPPVLSVPTTRYVEADGPNGSFVRFDVSASDAGAALLPSAIACDPSSGSLFPLGTTTVTCGARDAFGNKSTAYFGVIVQDTTPPAINAPNVSFTATGPDGIQKTDPAVDAYLARVSATDLVSTPTLTNTIPDVLPIGVSTVVFSAKDAAGNVATKRVTITVLPVGQKAPPPDLTPPPDVTGATAKAGDRSVSLTWRRPPADVAYVIVTQSVSGENGTGKEVYKGLATTVVAAGLENGKNYRFLIVAYDKAGNRSRGIVLRATPKADPLTSPKAAERVAKPPLLRWTSVRGATYFNVQLWRGSEKVLSAWPAANRYQLTSTWIFAGKKRVLAPGVYTWYVWPGLGARADVHYGALLGSRTFMYAPKKR